METERTPLIATSDHRPSTRDLVWILTVTFLSRTVGQAMGVSISGTIIQGVLVRELRSRITGPGSEELIDKIRHSTDLIRLDRKHQHDAVEAYKTALFATFISQVLFACMGLFSSLFIEEYPLPSALAASDESRVQNPENSENNS